MLSQFQITRANSVTSKTANPVYQICGILLKLFLKCLHKENIMFGQYLYIKPNKTEMAISITVDFKASNTTRNPLKSFSRVVYKKTRNFEE